MDSAFRSIDKVKKTESERLLRLHRYAILDTPSERMFDNIANLANDLMETKWSYISFVGAESVFFKSVNIDGFPQIVDREDSICANLLIQNVTEGVMEFPDLLKEPDNAGFICVAKFGIRYLACAPLFTPDRYCIGFLCAGDDGVHKASDKSLSKLGDLADTIMEILALRLSARRAIQVQHDLLGMVVHDIKNPLSTIRLYSQLIQRGATSSDKVKGMVARIIDSSDFVLDNLEKLLMMSEMPEIGTGFKLVVCNVSDMLSEMLIDFRAICKQKNQVLVTDITASKPVKLDKMRFREIMDNLLSNASKYSSPDSEIKLSARDREHDVVIELKDTGQGIVAEDKPNLFKKFARLSAVPTGKETSNGLGLSIVKTLVELHGGKVWAESEGKDMGATFFVTFPVAD